MKRVFTIFLAFTLLLGSLFLVSASNERSVVDKKSILSALYEADINTVREAIENRLISCEELTAYYLERIKKYNTPYNCFITLCDDALEVARERDAALLKGKNSGALFGVPIVIKDNMNLKGYYTTNGHLIEDSKVAKDDAYVVSLLLEQGAVIIGKTNMSTDAQDARASFSKIKGETKNAYSTLLSAGGSSGGTAAAVSLNFSVAGLGTDTNSSLRIPAILNGCVSLRTTLKKISFNGCTHLNNSRDVVGAVTRSVYDQAIMLDVLTENKYSYEQNLNTNTIKGLKLGILSELTYPVEASLITETDEELKDKKIKQFDIQYRSEKNVDEEVAQAFQKAVKELESCGAQVVTVSMPQLFESAYPTFAKNASAVKETFYNEIKSFMKENSLDALIFPTYLSTPLKSGTDSTGKSWNVWSQVFLNNCRVISPSTGMPEISLLIGNHSSGAGIGMEIVTYKDGEQLLLDIAYAYTQKYDCRIAPTGASDIYADWNVGSIQEISLNYEIPALSYNIIEKESKNENQSTIIEENPPTNLEFESVSNPTTEPMSPPVSDSNDTDNHQFILPVIIVVCMVVLVGITAFLIFKFRKSKKE